MKLQTLRRGGVATLAVLALSSGLAACGSSSSDGDATDAPSTTAPAETETTPADTGSTDSGTTGTADPAAQTFGPGCASVPTDPNDKGSFAGMVNDPVATAASNNPLLKQLVAAVGAAGLVDTLNDESQQFTVFAPYDPAFMALPKATVTALLKGAKKDGPTSDLAKILTHHVISGELDPTAVVGKQMTLDGDTLTVKGNAKKGMTVSDGKVTAKVLCGNIPTGNATVYVIDSVLAGAKL